MITFKYCLGRRYGSISIMKIISVLKETKKKPVSERTNKEKMVQG